MNTQFDVIVAGAGIAGLLLASELSYTKKVLLVEAKNEFQTSKYWVTLKSCIDVNPELSPLVDSFYKHMDFSDSSQNTFRLKGEYVLWNTSNLINYLKSIIDKNNSTVLFGQRFCGYRTKTNGIEIIANHMTYTAKLFIDCMGYESPLVLAKDMVRIKGYYLLYGAKLKLRSEIDPICLSNVMLNKRPKYFEAFPTSTKEVFSTIIYPTKDLSEMKGLASDFKFITGKSVYATHFESESVINRLWGIVPVGTINRHALDRIFFFGESAQSNPAASGTCLTRLLYSYKEVARYLDRCIELDDLSERKLAGSPVVLNDFARKLHLYAFKDILRWNSDRYSKFIQIINHVDPEVINKFLFGSITASDVITKKHVAALLKWKNLFLIKPLIHAFK